MMLVAAVSGDGNLLIVSRAANGTNAAAHAAGAAVTVLTDYAVNTVPTCSLVRRPDAAWPAAWTALESTAPPLDALLVLRRLRRRFAYEARFAPRKPSPRFGPRT